MNRPNEKLLKDMSIEELSTNSGWHAEQASALFEKVKEMRARALTLTINEAVELMRSAMVVAFEAEQHMRHANVLDSVRAARVPRPGAGLVAPAAKAYTVRQSL